MIVVGIDTSLTSTGLAHLDTSTGEWLTERVRSTAPADRSVRAQARRMNRIARSVREFAGRCEPPFGDVDLFVIEGMSLGSHSAFSRDVGGLWWRVVGALVAGSEVPLLVVAPATRAKYAAGSGRAKKPEVLAAVRETYPAADVPQHDVADAVALAALGARVKGFPVEQVARPWVEDVARQVAEREEKEQG